MECYLFCGYFTTYIFRNCNKYLDIVNGRVEKKTQVKKKQ